MKSFMIIGAIALIAAAVCVSASVHSSLRTPSTHHVLYSRDAAPADWSKHSRADGKASVEFTLALKQRNLDILDKWFHESSSPYHENYQSFKTIAEINALVAPTKADSKLIHSWLQSHGIHSSNIKSFGDSLDVKCTVSQAERLFHTQFFNFHHQSTPAKIIRQFGDYSVPRSLKHLIEMVTGISSFPVPHLTTSHRGGDVANRDTSTVILPQTLYAQYGITNEAAALSKKMVQKSKNGKTTYTPSQAVIEFGGQSFTPSDLAEWGQVTEVNVQVVPDDQIVGPNDPTQPGDESTLDIEMIEGVDTGATNWFWLEQGNGWLYTFSTHFFNTDDVPLVNSISYGWWEADQCDDQIDQATCQQLGVDSTGYVGRVNTEFQKIGARGISLLVASGDSGANGRTDPNCTIAQLRPSFPGTSPWVTSVGATELINTNQLSSPPAFCTQNSLDCVSTGDEQAVSYAVSGFGSGGGFSNITTRPSYQDDAVEAYLSSGVALPPSSYYNAGGRAHPDVSAIGHNLFVVYQGQGTLSGGTSAATPIFAGVISLLNSQLISQGGKPLGFLNPFLYQMVKDQPNTLTDITVGDNICTENGCASTCTGFTTTTGWDPVTGLGTPNFANMLDYVKSHGDRRAAHFAQRAAKNNKH